MIDNESNKMEKIETIIQWHKETFPDTTLEEQVKKFSLELTEFKEATTFKRRLYELADMVIVANSFFRFEKRDELVMSASKIINKSIDYLDRNYTVKNICERLEMAIDDKMAINRKRQWQYVDGEYRHI